MNQTFLAKTHTISLGDEPLLSPMKGVLLMPPVLVPEFRDPLQIGSGKTVQFLAPYLIHQDELDLKLGGGLAMPIQKLADREVTELYDPRRPSVLR